MNYNFNIWHLFGITFRGCIPKFIGCAQLFRTHSRECDRCVIDIRQESNHFFLMFNHASNIIFFLNFACDVVDAFVIVMLHRCNIIRRGGQDFRVRILHSIRITIQDLHSECSTRQRHCHVVKNVRDSCD